MTPRTDAFVNSADSDRMEVIGHENGAVAAESRNYLFHLGVTFAELSVVLEHSTHFAPHVD
jgi:hypothetical protein